MTTAMTTNNTLTYTTTTNTAWNWNEPNRITKFRDAIPLKPPLKPQPPPPTIKERRVHGMNRLGRVAFARVAKTLRGEPECTFPTDWRRLTTTGGTRDVLVGPDGLVYKVCTYSRGYQDTNEVEFETFQLARKHKKRWCPKFAMKAGVIIMPEYRLVTKEEQNNPTYIKKKRDINSHVRDSNWFNLGIDENGELILLDGGAGSSLQ
jgi:hypothetical protein